MNVKAALFPTIFAIAMAVASIGIPMPGTTISGTPWLIAAHEQFINATGQVTKVDNIAFYLWGFQYTVVGKTVQSTFIPYDPLGDFPMFSMYAVIIAIIIGILAIVSNRIPNITIKGIEIKIGRYNPITLLIISTMLMIMTVVYLDYSSRMTIIPMLLDNNYKVSTGIGSQFMGISVVGFIISIIVTYISEKSSKDSEEKEDEKDDERDDDRDGGILSFGDKKIDEYPNLKELVK